MIARREDKRRWIDDNIKCESEMKILNESVKVFKRSEIQKQVKNRHVVFMASDGQET